MLYFDDFMEAIENFPLEVKTALAKVRSLDDHFNQLDDAKKLFFDNCKLNRLSESEKELEKRRIDSYGKLMRKLDSELEKFRLELEADNSGITEQIEHKVNVLLGRAGPQSVNVVPKPEKRRLKQQRVAYQQSAITALGNKRKQNAIRNMQNSARMSTMKASSHIRGAAGQAPAAVPANEVYSYARQQTSQRKNISTKLPLIDQEDPRNSLDQSTDSFLSASGRRQSVAEMSSGSSITSTALSATPVGQQRRTSRPAKRKMIRDYENMSVNSFECDEDPEADDQLMNMLADLEGKPGGSLTDLSDGISIPDRQRHPYSRMDKGPISLGLTGDGDEDDQQKYCICNDVSHGEMIACDGANCLIEWFHYQCVGLTVAPKGKWYCSQCAAPNVKPQKKRLTRK